MMIRAYRMRGHFDANLDPLGHPARRRPKRSSIRSRYGFTEADLRPHDLHRQVLGPRIRADARDGRHPARAPIARRSASSSCTSRTRSRRAGSSSASRARTRRSPSPAKARRAILNKLIEAEGFEKFLDVKYTGTKRFGLDGAEALIPALEQIIKRGGQLGVKEIVRRHGPSRPPERARPGDGQAAPRAVPRIQGRLGHARTTSKARATSSIISAPRRTASSTATRCICR